MLGALALSSLVATTGCARGCTSSRPPIHLNPSMDDQPKVRAQTASTFFSDGASMRQPVPGTVPIGGLKEDSAFFTGKGADEQFVATIPVTVDEALLERGRQRYVIYCQPCHDARGDGKGILFQRGNVPTASFHQERILKYPDGQIFDVITNGQGLMAGYRWPIPPADRWAIVGYVRDLQRKRSASATSASTDTERASESERATRAAFALRATAPKAERGRERSGASGDQPPPRLRRSAGASAKAEERAQRSELGGVQGSPPFNRSAPASERVGGSGGAKPPGKS